MQWQHTQGLTSRSFTCGHCGNLVASAAGYLADGGHMIHTCPHCNEPTYFRATEQIPGVAPGSPVANVPAEIAALYGEARSCAAANAFTASVMASRKLLMNIAVSRGAKAGEPFITYVEYLASQGYVPPDGRGWVDHIRKKGNEATHEIVLMNREAATDLITFTEMLLKFIFEFPVELASI